MGIIMPQLCENRQMPNVPKYYERLRLGNDAPTFHRYLTARAMRPISTKAALDRPVLYRGKCIKNNLSTVLGPANRLARTQSIIEGLTG